MVGISVNPSSGANARAEKGSFGRRQRHKISRRERLNSKRFKARKYTRAGARELGAGSWKSKAKSDLKCKIEQKLRSTRSNRFRRDGKIECRRETLSAKTAAKLGRKGHFSSRKLWRLGHWERRNGKKRREKRFKVRNRREFVMHGATDLGVTGKLSAVRKR